MAINKLIIYVILFFVMNPHSISVGNPGDDYRLPEAEKIKGFLMEVFSTYMGLLSLKSGNYVIDDLKDCCTDKTYLKFKNKLEIELKIKGYNDNYKPLSYSIYPLEEFTIKPFFEGIDLVEGEISVRAKITTLLKVQVKYIPKNQKSQIMETRTEGVGSYYNFLLVRHADSFLIKNFFEEDESYIQDKYIMSHPEEFDEKEVNDARIDQKKTSYTTEPRH